MLYSEFVNKAIELTIVEADNGLFYLEPMWKSILFDNKMDIKRISNTKTNWEEILSVLQLEVTKRNTIRSKSNNVYDWVYEIISAKADPLVTDAENDYFKILSEYVKTSSAEQSSRM